MTAQQLLCAHALRAGFTTAVPLDVTTLRAREDVRAMCQSDKCHAYGKNWTCPPACGTLETCAAQMRAYPSGLLLQTTGTLEDCFDYETMMAVETRHRAALHQFAAQLRALHPAALCLGAGGCRVCAECAYPAPCRNPAQACSSMEAYGLLVSEVCARNHVLYYHGKNTITYTACVLYS